MFADGAVRLAGFAGVVLGWNPEAFWRATPAELAAVVTAAATAGAGGGEAAVPLDAQAVAMMRRAYPDG
jgi:uncharacterized phage protein (TIGR02216 family)